MSYYTVLSATSALLLRENFTMRRCRRRFNGPHRYILFDADNRIFHFDEASKNRRMGYTLHELLAWLTRNSKAAAEARSLLLELDTWHQMKTAS